MLKFFFKKWTGKNFQFSAKERDSKSLSMPQTTNYCNNLKY